MRKFETKNIDDATADELRDYAQKFLGIDVNGDTDAEVLAKVAAANEGPTIFVATEEERAAQTGSEPPKVEGSTEDGALVGSLGHSDPKVTLTLHAEERDGVVVSRHKEIGVNGRVWLLARGQSITIPYRLFLALKDAEREAITHDDQGNVRQQFVKNTPYNIEKMPPQEEIDAWHARVDQMQLP